MNQQNNLGTAKLDLLLRLGLVPAKDINKYRLALRQGELALQNPELRTKLLDLMNRILKITTKDPQIMQRIRYAVAGKDGKVEESFKQAPHGQRVINPATNDAEKKAKDLAFRAQTDVKRKRAKIARPEKVRTTIDRGNPDAWQARRAGELGAKRQLSVKHTKLRLRGSFTSKTAPSITDPRSTYQRNLRKYYSTYHTSEYNPMNEEETHYNQTFEKVVKRHGWVPVAKTKTGGTIFRHPKVKDHILTQYSMGGSHNHFAHYDSDKIDKETTGFMRGRYMGKRIGAGSGFSSLDRHLRQFHGKNEAMDPREKLKKFIKQPSTDSAPKRKEGEHPAAYLKRFLASKTPKKEEEMQSYTTIMSEGRNSKLYHSWTVNGVRHAIHDHGAWWSHSEYHTDGQEPTVHVGLKQTILKKYMGKKGAFYSMKNEAKKYKDMNDKKCEKCGKGKYTETGFFDDMDGVLHCDNKKCGHSVKRYKVNEEGGAGYIGTKELVNKYASQTPGQSPNGFEVAKYSAQSPIVRQEDEPTGSKSPKTFADIRKALSGVR